MVSIQLGANIASDRIRAGSDVYLECDVRAIPPAEEVTWLFEGAPLVPDRAAGMFVANQTLVLQAVSRAHRGNYQCAARNRVGEGRSVPLFLRVLCKFQSGHTL